jgi:peptidoglycan hydrolase-like protein with peptidoglycan-binding domain
VPDDVEAITPEDEDQLAHIGEEADPPEDAGREPEEDYPDAAAAVAVDETAATGPPPDAAGAAAWRVARCLLELRAEINARWPNRDKRSDGSIGDANHCGPGKTSDHCVNAAGVVRALDTDADGIPAAALAEHVRKRGAAGDPRLANGGYVIFNHRIASWSHNWVWRAYNGSNPHTSHFHVSVSKDASGYDRSGSWEIGSAPTTGPTTTTRPAEALPVHPLGSRVLRLQSPHIHGTDVAFVQRWVGAGDDGSFGDETHKRVVRFQGIVGLDQNGVVDAVTWRAMRVG